MQKVGSFQNKFAISKTQNNVKLEVYFEFMILFNKLRKKISNQTCKVVNS